MSHVSVVGIRVPILGKSFCTCSAVFSVAFLNQFRENSITPRSHVLLLRGLSYVYILGSIYLIDFSWPQLKLVIMHFFCDYSSISRHLINDITKLLSVPRNGVTTYTFFLLLCNIFSKLCQHGRRSSLIYKYLPHLYVDAAAVVIVVATGNWIVTTGIFTILLPFALNCYRYWLHK